jgi:transcriptional regulator with XRE-family HTH domain
VTKTSTNLKFLRKEKKLSQAELASRLSLSRSNIAAYEAGNSEPNLKKVVLLSDFFDVPLRDFIMLDLSQEVNRLKGKSSQELEKVLQANIVELQVFQERTKETKKMISGFREFFKLKMSSYGNISADIQSLANDFENLLHVSEHIIEHNQEIFDKLNNNSTANEEPNK